MNEIKEILTAVMRDGISDERLEEIREAHTILGKILDSAQSLDGIEQSVVGLGWQYLETQERKTEAN